MIETLILLATGLVAGFAGGILGIGGGIVVIPSLVMILGFSQKTAQGTSLAFLLPPVSILAVMNYYNAGHVNVKAALLMACTFLVGSYLSSKLAISLPEDVVKKIFAVFLVLYALKLFFGK